jgi:dTDP-L-rhamnose 4-epimerase
MRGIRPGERVLITGGAGFIGTRLAEELAATGDTVRVLDALLPQVHGADPDSTSPLYRSVRRVAQVEIGSVTSRDALEHALRDIDVVVHLAAETGTGQSMYEIDRYVRTNIGGTGLLLDILANAAHHVRKLVVASSRSIYGEGRYVTEDGTFVYPGHRAEADMVDGDFEAHADGHPGPLRLVATDESSLIHPSSVYGITKQAQEQLVMVSSPTIGIAPVSLRFQNVYGPGQSLSNPYTGILSIFSTLIREQKRINVFEDGLESRDFVYIDDAVDATVRAIRDDRANGEVFNVGSGVPTSVSEVVEALFAAFGRRVDVHVSGSFRLGDIRHNYADIGKITELLEFSPRVDFRTGVTRLVDWVQQQDQSGGAYLASLDEMRSRNLLK